MQFLSDAIPNDIRISERETSLAANASADYLLQGAILEAKVDTSEKRGQPTVHVVTEQEQVPNPEHARWLDLSSRERRKTPEPPKLVIAERKEEVPVEVTLHRKVGLFSVSYRVIDAATASVFFANSARAREEYEDTSHEGVELGDFKLEPERASLLSDMEILARLADRISDTIGAELVKVLGNPEDHYRASAEAFLKEGNPRSAAREYAYAIVLSESKDEDASELLEQLRLSAVAASPASGSEGQP
jgi:hypothetical protein